MAYVDIDFYKKTYKGSVIPDAAFDYWATQASGYLDCITFDRAASSLDDRVRMAACAVAEAMYKLDKDGGIIASEHSGSYIKTLHVGSRDTAERRKYNAAALYLANTGLMYRGAD